MFYFKFFKLNWNIVSETEIFSIYNYILNKLVYCILINYIIVGYLKVKLLSKEYMKINNFIIIKLDVGENTQDFQKISYSK